MLVAVPSVKAFNAPPGGGDRGWACRGHEEDHVVHHLGRGKGGDQPCAL